jgi:hypothetical protein
MLSSAEPGRPVCIGREEKDKDDLGRILVDMIGGEWVLDQEGYDIGCQIHDRCYYISDSQGRNKHHCDLEQLYNHAEMCKNKFQIGSFDYNVCYAKAALVFNVLTWFAGPEATRKHEKLIAKVNSAKCDVP